jgi:hypothetical protein
VASPPPLGFRAGSGPLKTLRGWDLPSAGTGGVRLAHLGQDRLVARPKPDWDRILSRTRTLFVVFCSQLGSPWDHLFERRGTTPRTEGVDLRVDPTGALGTASGPREAKTPPKLRAPRGSAAVATSVVEARPGYAWPCMEALFPQSRPRFLKRGLGL